MWLNLLLGVYKILSFPFVSVFPFFLATGRGGGGGNALLALHNSLQHSQLQKRERNGTSFLY